MNIQDAAGRSGLTVKSIRYYEDLGLVQPLRQSNGYRQFSEEDVARLAFLAQARALGFSLADCRALLQLRDDPARSNSAVKAIAQAHLDGIDDRIAALEQMRGQLSALVSACADDGQSACAILDGI